MDDEKLGAILAAANQLFFTSRRKLLLIRTTHFTGLNEAPVSILLATTSNKEKILRVPLLCETWISNYTEAEFFSHFRMGTATFNALLAEVGLQYEKDRYHGGLQPIKTEKALLILLWLLAKGDTYLSTADRFAVAPSTAHLIISRMLDVLYSLKNKFIKWPTKIEVPFLEKKFQYICGFPGIIGAIDGSHIMCKVKEDQHDSYQNRKCQHSIIMQATCSADRLLTNIFVGFPGRCNDARVLRESPLFKQLIEEGIQETFYENYHLIGDKAYPLHEWLLTPFKDNGRLTRHQKNYNLLLSRSRVVIEHVFGMLKGRWRILIYVNAYSMERIVKIVGACSVLHNICLLNNDSFDELFTEEAFADEREEEEANMISGQEKRDMICTALENYEN